VNDAQTVAAASRRVRLTIEPGDFDYAPFAQQGGLGRASALFGSGLPGLLEEMNRVLTE